ncbi:ATP-binding protein [Streptomyces sp. NPDC051940]|uniref:ATP-binding protein n=1 Tax=Streptomyces sp. NPDC051940 TaxID=3155675 RepID=UPI00342E6F6B
MRQELASAGAPEAAVDDAVLILSELLSNSCRHARPLAGTGTETEPDEVRASWTIDSRGLITVAVTDGGGPTRPLPATPSVTAHGGRGLAIIRRLSKEWGVSDHGGEVTVWATLPRHSSVRHDQDFHVSYGDAS